MTKMKKVVAQRKSREKREKFTKISTQSFASADTVGGEYARNGVLQANVVSL